VSPAEDGVCACAGAPRDLGFDQGRGAAEALRRALAEIPPWTRIGVGWPGFAGGGLETRSRRDAARFFPHMSERMAGLARGAGVARRPLEALLARELAAAGAGGAGSAFGAALVAAPERTGAGPLAGRLLAAPPGAGARPWLLRRSAPEHDWRSLEVTLPWLVPALAGVNERGLAVLAVVLAPAPASLAECAAPALLLAQDCLQRCDGTQKAIEWCERRPAGGCAALLFADAAGDVAEVAVAGAERRVRRTRDGLLASAADPGAARELEKACALEAALDAAALARVLLGCAPAAEAARGGRRTAAVVLDPAARALELGGTRYPVVADR
jgi:hypothetical protein